MTTRHVNAIAEFATGAPEIITGIEEIKAWKRGEVKLRTFTVELPRAADVPHIRRDSARWAEVIKRSGTKID